MAKKNKKLFDAAGEAARKLESKKTNTGGSGLTQDQINAGIQARRNSILSQPTRHQGTNSTAPAATTGSGRFGALELDRIQRHAGVESTYFEDERKASERIKERSTSAMNRLANAKGPGQEMQVLHEMADERRRLNNTNKLRDRSNQGAGKMNTYTNADGSTGYYYQRGKGEQAQFNATFNKNVVPSRVNGMMPQVIDAKNKSKQTNIDKGNYYTQESASTMKYDDGKRTEYFEIQGTGDDRRLVSVPEERYYQRVQLDGGINPATLTPWKQYIEAPAKHGLENAKLGLESTWGSIQANKNDQQRAKEYAETHPDGNNLNRRRDMLMSSYGAAGATKSGNDVKANEYVKQEAVEDILREREQLDKQRELDQLYQAYKAGVSKPAGVFMDVVDTTANMAPGMLSNFILPGSFIPEMAVQAYGNSYNQARNNGASRDEAVLSGLQNAAVESLSEMMFAGGKTLGRMTGVSGIFRPGKEIEEASLGFIRSTAGKDVVRTVQKLGLAGAEEGAEELVAGIVEPLLDNLIYQHEDINSEWVQNMLHDAAYNALVGFASGGGFGAVDVAQSIQQGADIRAHADVANMINQGLAMPEGSEANNIARRMQLQDPANYGNIDTSDLARAIQEGQKDINETVSKKQKNTDQILERKNIGHRAEAAEASYNRALQSESMHEEAIKSGMSEAEAEGIRIEMSALGEEFGRYYEDAKAALADRLMPAMAEEASEDPDVVEANRAEAERQAEDGARTIARVMMGEATAADFQKFSTTNPAVREAYQQITGKQIPTSNEAAIDFMINENEDHYVAEQTTEQGRQMLREVADFFGEESPEYEAFENAIEDLSNMDPDLLSGAVRGFSDAYSLGRASAVDDVLPARTPAMEFLTDRQIQKAFEAGKKERDTYLKNKRSNLNRAKKAAATRAKNAAYKKGGNFSMESLDDGDANKVSDGVKAFFEKTAKRYGVNIVIEPNAKFVKGSKVSNGFYDPKTNTIHLNVDMKNNGQVSGFIPTFSHEFTHFLEDMAPEEYQMLHDFVVRTVNAKDPDRWEAEIQERMHRYGKGLTRAEAEREVIADMAQEIFADEKTISEFFGYDKSVAQKVMDAVTKIINEFIQFVKGTGESQFLKQIGAWEEYRDMWMRAAKAAKENGGLQVGSDVRNQLQDVGMTEQNGRAAWLPERVDNLMQRYGGSGNYSQAWAVMMNPRDFLKLTLSDDQLDRWSSSAQNVPGDVQGMPYREAVDRVWSRAKETGKWIHDNENYPLDQDELASNEQTPFISIYEDSTGKIHVDGHEGRHRMRALMEAGITSVPVVVKDLSTKYSKTNIDSMTLGSQDFGRGPVNNNASVTVTDLVPIRRDNRDELMEKFGAKDEDQVRFQMQSPVEQKGDLIAMHNMTGEELLKTIDLGGFPMPSIAVTRASMGHSKYGDVSLLFHSDTIDPQRNRDNQVFGGDAYTPTFPSIRIKVNDKVESRISKIYYDLYSQYGYDAVRAMYSIAENLEDRLNNAGGEAALIDELKNDTALKRVFLLTKGKEIENVETRTEERMSDAEIEVCEFLINELGEDVVRDVSVPGGGIGHVREWYANNGEAVRAAYRKLLRENFGFNEQEVKNAEDSMNTMRYATEVRRAKTFMEKGPVTVKTEIDHDATNNAIEKEATKAGYDAWIEDLLSGAEEKQGIRNTKDPFTPSGNRRSWDALHDPVTLQNVVKAMRSELAAGGNGLFGANPKGAAQKEYKSLDELRADKGRLEMLSDEEYERLSGEALDSFTAVCQSIARHNYQDFDTHFGATLDTGESIAEVLNETRTKAGIKRALEKDYHLSVTDAEMNDLMDAIDAIANVPTGYFEAKPRRAVGLDEIRAAVIPDTASAELKDALDQNGIEYIEYKEGDEEERKAKVNEAAEEKDLRFQFADDAFIDKDSTGKPLAVITTDIFEGKTGKRKVIVTNYLKDNIGSRFRVAEDGHYIYVGAKADAAKSRRDLLPNKYQRGKSWQRLGRALRYAKQRGAAGIGRMIEIASFNEWTNRTDPQNPD
ncbi:MAG: hypothetical protein J6N19_02200, partial [Clostridium sp.]|nr:hypothetical protein [Clostridium sp.]